MLQALVRERMNDWGKGLCTRLGKKMVELTGDYTPDLRALLSADIIICTPEKWDGISRNWQNRTYVQKVRLLVMDEIHLLGADRYQTCCLADFLYRIVLLSVACQRFACKLCYGECAVAAGRLL